MFTACSVPVKNQIKACAAVIDAESGREVFFNRGFIQDGDPAKPKHVQKLMDKIFNDFRK